MIDIHEAFISAIVRQSPGLKWAYKQILEYWSPEEPPVTTLFAALGDRIATDYQMNEPEVNRRIFARIEEAMNSGDHRLVMAVATGLIESMVCTMIEKKQTMEKLLNELGALSRMHVEAWIGDTIVLKPNPGPR